MKYTNIIAAFVAIAPQATDAANLVRFRNKQEKGLDQHTNRKRTNLRPGRVLAETASMGYTTDASPTLSPSKAGKERRAEELSLDFSDRFFPDSNALSPSKAEPTQPPTSKSGNSIAEPTQPPTSKSRKEPQALEQAEFSFDFSDRFIVPDSNAEPTQPPTRKSGKELHALQPAEFTMSVSMEQAEFNVASPDDPAAGYSNDINSIFFGLQPSQFELDLELAQLSMPVSNVVDTDGSGKHGKARKLVRRRLVTFSY